MLVSSYEGLSHVLLEAMAVGVPIVASEVGGNPELVAREEEGLLVPYGDARAAASAAMRLLTERDCAQELAQNARTKVAAFSKDRMLTDTIKLFHNLEK